ncbi:MAG: dephospho-CoA kinase [Gammaproteobacteria bacterium]|nr:dephospho-CoA kinase [Gammaproteobacteria bacterium]
MSADKLIIGLTGGIGSGKSAAADFFNQLGVTIVDADLASRKVVAPGQPALSAIKDHFGTDILINSPKGKVLDRDKLRSIIFAHPEEREWINSLLHPLIRQQMDEEVAQSTSSYVIKVVPLLIETAQKNQVHRILLIDVSKDIQRLRVEARDNSSIEEINRIIKSQATREERIKVADDIIDNNSSVDDLEKAVKKMHNKYMKLIVE